MPSHLYRETNFREMLVLTQSSAANQAHLCSHSSPRAELALHRSPTALEFQLHPEVFRSTLLERLRLPLHMAEATCECGGTMV